MTTAIRATPHCESEHMPSNAITEAPAKYLHRSACLWYWIGSCNGCGWTVERYSYRAAKNEVSAHRCSAVSA